MNRKLSPKTTERLFLLKGAAGLFFFFCFVFLLLRLPKEAQDGVAQGVQLCLETLIPAMLPLLIFSAFFQLSFLGEAASALLEKPTKLVFGMPGAGAGALLFAALGGFPAGAASIAAAVEQQSLDRRDGRCLQLLAFCPSAAFTIAAVGNGMLGSTRAGVLLELSVLLPLPLLAQPMRVLMRRSLTPRPRKKTILPTAQAFLQAVERGAHSMLMVCIFVCLFSVLPPMLSRFPFPQSLRLWVLALPELTTGVARAAKSFSLPALTGLLSFGGFCAHCQVLPVLQKLRLSYWKFFLFRLCHAALSALLCRILLPLFPMEAAVFSAQSTTFAPSAASSAAVSVCLCCMCALLLLGGDTVFQCRACKTEKAVL